MKAPMAPYGPKPRPLEGPTLGPMDTGQCPRAKPLKPSRRRPLCAPAPGPVGTRGRTPDDEAMGIQATEQDAAMSLPHHPAIVQWNMVMVSIAALFCIVARGIYSVRFRNRMQATRIFNAIKLNLMILLVSGELRKRKPRRRSRSSGDGP